MTKCCTCCIRAVMVGLLLKAFQRSCLKWDGEGMLPIHHTCSSRWLCLIQRHRKLNHSSQPRWSTIETVVLYRINYKDESFASFGNTKNFVFKTFLPFGRCLLRTYHIIRQIWNDPFEWCMYKSWIILFIHLNLQVIGVFFRNPR